MPWCPKCKTEYEQGATICSDCGTKLVKQIKDGIQYEAVTFVDESIAKRLVKLLLFSDIPSARMIYDPVNHHYEVQVDRPHYQKALDLVNIFKENEFNNNLAEDNNFQDGYETSSQTTIKEPYESYHYKYSSNITAAYSFTIIGAVGLLFIIINDLKLLPFLNFTNISGVLFNIVLGGLFIFFIIIGIFSFKRSKDYKSKAIEEDSITKELMNFLSERYDSHILFDMTSDVSSEEVSYFKKLDIIKAAISSKYDDLSPAYVDKIADDFLQSITYK